MEIPTKVIINCSTGERSIVPLTPEEIAEREAMAAQAELDRIAEEEAAQALADLKASAKEKLIAGEPLTAEEAATIVL
jgi:formylmethanofuran dehydrogenase subunit B